MAAILSTGRWVKTQPDTSPGQTKLAQWLEAAGQPRKHSKKIMFNGGLSKTYEQHLTHWILGDLNVILKM